jgi:thiamine phosphate synthase YjbQ (UPF0047 family)
VRVHSRIYSLKSGPTVAFIDVTGLVREAVISSDINEGIVYVYSQHTTCSVLIQSVYQEEDISDHEMLSQDLIDILEKFIPTMRRLDDYFHPGPMLIVHAAGIGEPLSDCLNTDGHLRSMLMGRSESIPLVQGNMVLEKSARIFFIDFDQRRARERILRVQITGE